MHFLLPFNLLPKELLYIFKSPVNCRLQDALAVDIEETDARACIVDKLDEIWFWDRW